MSKVLLTSAFTILLFVCKSFACGPEEGTLIGKGRLTYGWFNIKLYMMRYYKYIDPQLKTESRFLSLKFDRNISRDLLNKGWEKGLKDNLKNAYNTTHKDAVSWVINHTVSAKEKDCMILEVKKSMDSNKFLSSSISNNNKVVASTSNEKVGEILFMPWIGEVPVDKDLKEKLVQK